MIVIHHWHADAQQPLKAENAQDSQTNALSSSNVAVAMNSTEARQESSAEIGASDVSNLSLQIGIGHSINQGHQPSSSSPGYIYHNASASSLASATTQESSSTPSSPVDMSLAHGECVYNYTPQTEHLYVPQSSTNGQHVGETQTKWYQSSDSSLYHSTPNNSSMVLHRYNPRKRCHNISSYSEDRVRKQHWQPTVILSGPSCTSGKKPTNSMLRVPVTTNSYQYNGSLVGEVPWSEPQLPIYQAHDQFSVPATCTNSSGTSVPNLGTPHSIRPSPAFVPVGQTLAAGSNEKAKAAWGSEESNCNHRKSTICHPNQLLQKYNLPGGATKSNPTRMLVQEEENLSSSWSSTSSISIATESNQSSSSGCSTLINSLSQSLSTFKNSGINFVTIAYNIIVGLWMLYSSDCHLV